MNEVTNSTNGFGITPVEVAIQLVFWLVLAILLVFYVRLGVVAIKRVRNCGDKAVLSAHLVLIIFLPLIGAALSILLNHNHKNGRG
jgi:hypothetical protein